MKTYKELIEILNEQTLNEGVYDRGVLKSFHLAGGPGCFAPDTPVLTIDGYKRIDEMNEGDFVKTLDEENNIVEKPVLDVLQNTIVGVTQITLEDDSTILCSYDHKFRLADGSWKEASQLEKDDDLYDI